MAPAQTARLIRSPARPATPEARSPHSSLRSPLFTPDYGLGSAMVCYRSANNLATLSTSDSGSTKHPLDRPWPRARPGSARQGMFAPMKGALAKPIGARGPLRPQTLRHNLTLGIRRLAVASIGARHSPLRGPLQMTLHFVAAVGLVASQIPVVHFERGAAAQGGGDRRTLLRRGRPRGDGAVRHRSGVGQGQRLIGGNGSSADTSPQHSDPGIMPLTE